MQINKNCNLILTDLFDYDIATCNYSLLKSLGWDLSSIPFEDKLKRNITIGIIQKENPRLAKYLLETTNGIIQYYLEKNKILGDEIITRQRDGLIVSKKLRITTGSLELEFRGLISKMIISMNRRQYLCIYDNGKVSVKGVSNKPIDYSFYNLFRLINFSSKKLIVSTVELMRQKILSSDKHSWFAFEKDGGIYVPIVGEGEIKIDRAGLRNLDINEIEKNIIWSKYVWPFVETLMIYCRS